MVDTTATLSGPAQHQAALWGRKAADWTELGEVLMTCGG